MEKENEFKEAWVKRLDETATSLNDMADKIENGKITEDEVWEVFWALKDEIVEVIRNNADGCVQTVHNYQMALRNKKVKKDVK